jgi:hypothetical protein
MSVHENENIVFNKNKTKMKTTEDDRFKCPICGSKIKNNPNNVKKHNTTIKHQNALNGIIPVTRAAPSDDVKKIAERKRIADYRERKRRELGDAEYKKAQSNYKKIYRNKTKINPISDVEDEKEIKLEENMDEVDEMKGNETEIKINPISEVEMKTKDEDKDETKELIIDRLVKASKGTVKARTITENLTRIYNIYKFIYNKPWNYVTYDWLKDVNTIYDQVVKKYKNMSEKTRSNQFASIAGILKFFPYYKKEKGMYSKLATGIVEKLDKISKDNNLSKKQRDWLNWSQVEDVWPKLDKEDTFIKALYAIYCFIPVRRVMDYQLMKIVRKDKITDVKIKQLNKNFNYIFVNKNREPISMTIWNYKESAQRSWAKKNNNHGEYVLDPLPDKLSKVLHEYIINKNLNGNDFLFGLPSNYKRNYTETAFSSLISNIFEKFSSVHMTVNALRHSYASWHWDKLNSYNLKEAFSFRMGSSQHEIGKTYYKIQLTPTYDKK